MTEHSEMIPGEHTSRRPVVQQHAPTAECDGFHGRCPAQAELAAADTLDGLPWYALGLEGADPATEIADLRKRIHHMGAALSGENEGVRLWMLDCGNLVDQHRRDADAARSALQAAQDDSGRLRAGLESAEMALVTWRSQNDYFRELVGEILDALPNRYGRPFVTVTQIAEWRERAGIEPPVAASKCPDSGTCGHSAVSGTEGAGT